MKQRILTAIMLIVVVLPIFFFKNYFLFILLLVALMAALELNNLIADKKYPLLIITTFLLISAFGLDFFTNNDKITVASIGLLTFAVIDLIYMELKLYNLSLVYTVALLIGFALSAISNLYNINLLFVIFVILANYSSDAGAYLVGSRFGKKKLAPKISPNKTVEGSLGGIVFSGVIGSVFGIIFLLDDISIFKIVILSLIISVVSQTGDLFFSSLKRNYDIKDFGSIFPGHGGVLDRIDSLIFSLLFIMILIRLGFLGVFV